MNGLRGSRGLSPRNEKQVKHEDIKKCCGAKLNYYLVLAEAINFGGKIPF